MTEGYYKERQTADVVIACSNDVGKVRLIKGKARLKTF
jgi:hypothetical protein